MVVIRRELPRTEGANWVDVICEEAKHGMESIAETVAKRGGIRYCNIEMSPRESDILRELLGAITGARGAVVICGVSHMPVLAPDGRMERFEQVCQQGRYRKCQASARRSRPRSLSKPRTCSVFE